MRRFLLWHLPLATSIVAVALFGYGLVQFLAGNLGTPVQSAAVETKTEAPRGLIVPIILGDSLARGAGDESGRGIGGRLDEELRRRGVRARPATNLGVNGARTADLLRELERPNVRTLIAGANTVIVSIGGNDLWGGNDWRTASGARSEAVMGGVLERVERIVRTIRGVNPRARIFFVGLYNPFAAAPGGRDLSTLVNRWNARLIERFEADPDFTVVATSDLFSHRDRLALDRFHPDGEAYGLIARRIADAM